MEVRRPPGPGLVLGKEILHAGAEVDGWLPELGVKPCRQAGIGPRRPGGRLSVQVGRKKKRSYASSHARARVCVGLPRENKVSGSNSDYINYIKQ